MNTIEAPTPIEALGNTALRDSINAALAGIEAGHGNALLHVDNGGAGVLVAHRFNDTWALVAGGRYDFKTKTPGVQVDLVGSW